MVRREPRWRLIDWWSLVLAGAVLIVTVLFG